jgi:hypothetical protein
LLSEEAIDQGKRLNLRRGDDDFSHCLRWFELTGGGSTHAFEVSRHRDGQSFSDRRITTSAITLIGRVQQRPTGPPIRAGLLATMN